MELPEGIMLERDGKDPVKTYGEHVYRSFAGAYPNTKPKDIAEAEEWSREYLIRMSYI